MLKEFVKKLAKTKINSKEELMLTKRKLSRKLKTTIFSNAQILQEYQQLLNAGEIKKNLKLEKILRKRAIRTLSGIAPVAVLTKPFPCPGKCAYCPTEKNVPQSYLSNEPAVMRAIRCKYNPFVQIQARLKALEINGHKPNKIELIVIGGTWSVLPNKYKYWFIKECFRGANTYNQKNTTKNKSSYSQSSLTKLKEELKYEQQKNESAQYRIVGLTLETRPDYIDDKELKQMRELGCTRVELGVQAIDNKILKINRRGHEIKEIIKATQLLRNYGFKITYHLMPGLPGSTPQKDLQMFKQIFSCPNFQPDQIKFYPTVVTKGSLLYKWWKNGKYIPYSDETLRKLIIECKKIVPPYVRIIRLIRDIPEESIIAGNKITNLRQIMLLQGVKCSCIRCREARDKKFNLKEAQLNIIKYKVKGGEENFLQFESKDKKTLFGFCRLFLPQKDNPTSLIPKNSALIRELHVYGELIPPGGGKKIQHSGLGKKLMLTAEKLAQKHNFKYLTVISGVGVRNYYRRLGYRLFKTYMIKKLNK